MTTWEIDSSPIIIRLTFDETKPTGTYVDDIQGQIDTYDIERVYYENVTGETLYLEVEHPESGKTYSTVVAPFEARDIGIPKPKRFPTAPLNYKRSVSPINPNTTL